METRPKPEIDINLIILGVFFLKIQKIQAKIIYQEAIVNYLEQILRMINNRSFTIKNAIEWRRFTSGAL